MVELRHTVTKADCLRWWWRWGGDDADGGVVGFGDVAVGVVVEVLGMVTVMQWLPGRWMVVVLEVAVFVMLLSLPVMKFRLKGLRHFVFHFLILGVFFIALSLFT